MKMELTESLHLILFRQRGGEFSLIDFPLPNPLKVVNGKLGFIQLIFSFGTNFNLISLVGLSSTETVDCDGLKVFLIPWRNVKLVKPKHSEVQYAVPLNPILLYLMKLLK